MNASHLEISVALRHATTVVLDRLEALQKRVLSGDEDAWSPFLDAARTLATLADVTTPGRHGELLTTKQMAEKLGITTSTLLKRMKRKDDRKVTPALRLGTRGRAAIRWRGDEVVK